MNLIEKARDLAYYLEKEAGRPGAAVVIHDLVAEVEKLETQLAAVDAMVSVHTNQIDPAPRSSWPKGSILEAALARHEKRMNPFTTADTTKG